MSLVSLPGGLAVPLGIGQNLHYLDPDKTTVTLDAANEATIFIGRVVTSDGASHTIDTTGSSSLQWRSETAVFASGSTTVKVGLAAVDMSNGPPGRAVNSTNVITFDVARSMTGGGGGITANAWQTHVPTTGTKTVANGDLVAFAVQMTARGGADSIVVSVTGNTQTQIHSPLVTAYTGGSYAAQNAMPIAVIVFSDGALGWFYASDGASANAVRTFNSGSSPNEYGQLYSFPFPYRAYGIYGWIAPAADCDIVFYTDPLGTPVATKTLSLDANTVANTSGRRFWLPFPAPYDVAPNTPVATVFKPGGSNISAYYKTLGSATHRVTDTGGTSSYGVSRASGAFADANSSLDHYYIGLLVGGVEHGVQPNFVLGI